MSNKPRAIVVGHADFAAGIISAVNQITGSGARLVPISSAGHGAAGIERMIREVVEETGVRVIFTDLPGGSATMAAMRVQRNTPGLTVATGTNLAVLLDFVQRDAGVLDGGPSAALEKGKASMIVFQPAAKDGN
jgi:PTS system N-acetylgalactosamine-specific IIA component